MHSPTRDAEWELPLITGKPASEAVVTSYRRSNCVAIGCEAGGECAFYHALVSNIGSAEMMEYLADSSLSHLSLPLSFPIYS